VEPVGSISTDSASPLAFPGRALRIGALVAGLGFAATGVALADTLPPCSGPVSSADALFVGAEAEGFELVEADGVLPRALAERLRWIAAMPYLAADSGGEPLATILDMQLRAAANYGRLRTTPMSAAQVFTRDGSVLLIRWQEFPAGEIAVSCSLALFSDQDPMPAQTTGRYGVFSSEKADAGDGNVKVTFERYQFDQAAILAEVPAANPPSAVVTVLMRYNRESLE
jgi:hypothetical protein